MQEVPANDTGQRISLLPEVDNRAGPAAIFTRPASGLPGWRKRRVVMQVLLQALGRVGLGEALAAARVQEAQANGGLLHVGRVGLAAGQPEHALQLFNLIALVHERLQNEVVYFGHVRMICLRALFLIRQFLFSVT